MCSLHRLVALSLVALGVWGCGSHAQKPVAAGSSAVQSKSDGTGRINVKHATDPDAKKIDKAAKDISVEDLIATKLPSDLKGDLADYDDKRIGPFEESTFRVKGTLKSVVRRKDGDYYLVMEGKSGATAIIEVPDPKQAQGSPILPEIEAARKAIEDKYHPTDTAKDINEPATIEGVGCYGWKNSKGSGGHGSNPRLMPGTGFKPGS